MVLDRSTNLSIASIRDGDKGDLGDAVMTLGVFPRFARVVVDADGDDGGEILSLDMARVTDCLEGEEGGELLNGEEGDEDRGL